MVGLAAGLPGFCRLEEARTKLLLAECAGDFEGLLARAEAQALLRRGPARSSRKPRTEDRAKRLAAEGAYSKSLGVLTTQLADPTPEQQRHYATRLLPPSQRGEAWKATPTADSDPANTEQQHQLRGVRFKAMTAFGPTGTRPEHAQEALNVYQKPAWLRP